MNPAEKSNFMKDVLTGCAERRNISLKLRKKKKKNEIKPERDFSKFMIENRIIALIFIPFYQT